MEQSKAPQSELPEEFIFDGFVFTEKRPEPTTKHVEECESTGAYTVLPDDQRQDHSHSKDFDFDSPVAIDDWGFLESQEKKSAQPIPQIAQGEDTPHTQLFKFSDAQDPLSAFSSETPHNSHQTATALTQHAFDEQKRLQPRWSTQRDSAPKPEPKKTWSLSSLLGKISERESKPDTLTNRKQLSDEFTRDTNSKTKWESQGDPIGILSKISRLFVSAKSSSYRERICIGSLTEPISVDNQKDISSRIGTLAFSLKQIEKLIGSLEGSAAEVVLRDHLAQDIVADVEHMIERITGKSSLPLAETLAGKSNPFAKLSTIHDQEVLRCTQAELRAQEALNRKLLTEIEKAHLCNLANFRAAKIASECNQILLSEEGVRKIEAMDTTLQSLLDAEKRSGQGNRVTISALNTLINARLTNMAQICAMDDEELLSIPKVGKNTVQEIRRVARQMELPEPFASIPAELRDSRAQSFIWPVCPGEKIKEHLQDICGATLEDAVEQGRVKYHLLTKLPYQSERDRARQFNALFG